MYQFKKMSIVIVDEKIKSKVLSLKKDIKECSLEYLSSLTQYGLKSDKEHNYKQFLKGYEIDNNQYLILFGTNSIVTDWKWLGYSKENIADIIISVMYEIQ